MANFITLKEENYPKLLKEIFDPPDRFFYKGNFTLLDKTGIAIVGTRKNTEYGEYIVEKIVKELSIYDIAIVSGLAKGIDRIAHEQALKNNLPTIAILGSGIDNIYPTENIKLASEIEQKGLIISEFEGKTEPLPMNFPRRNRIISGISIAVVVVEAPKKSGALITADFALEQGRDIFVIPGDIDRENSEGILNLLQKGAAYPISSGTEIIEILKKQPPLILDHRGASCLKVVLPKQDEIDHKGTSCLNEGNLINLNISEEEKMVFSTLFRQRGLTLEQIQNKLKMSTETLLTTISLLEINGLIKIRDEKYYKKC